MSYRKIGDYFFTHKITSKNKDKPGLYIGTFVQPWAPLGRVILYHYLSDL